MIHEIRTNPLSFHHVTKSHISYAGAYQEPEKFLPFSLRYIESMKKNKSLVKDDLPAIYKYEQKRQDGRCFVGYIALCSVNDYLANKIKKHEEIRPSRLNFLVELFKTTKIMGEPTLLAHNGSEEIDTISGEELLNFESIDGKHHIITAITDTDAIDQIQRSMNQVENFYIADGHHRSASAARFNEDVDSLSNDLSMCYIIHENQLEILPFHRLIKPIVPYTTDQILSKLSRDFSVLKSSESLYQVFESNIMGMYLNGDWYKLTPNKSSSQLDIEVVEELIIRKVFGIADSRSDSQLTFHAFTSGEKELTGLIDDLTYKLAITTKPCDFSEVRRVADANNTLPPKSTYIEPKLRAGMIIQEFELIK